MPALGRGSDCRLLSPCWKVAAALLHNARRTVLHTYGCHSSLGEMRFDTTYASRTPDNWLRVLKCMKNRDLRYHQMDETEASGRGEDEYQHSSAGGLEMLGTSRYEHHPTQPYHAPTTIFYRGYGCNS